MNTHTSIVQDHQNHLVQIGLCEGAFGADLVQIINNEPHPGTFGTLHHVVSC